MSEHEIWNELGNLYFFSGLMDQAVYAYNRSIDLQEDYGLPYCNLAHIKFQQGNLGEAEILYKQSIEFLVTQRHKAISWYRLGDVFRRLKNYRDAIMAYQQADALDANVSKILEGSKTFLYGPSDIQLGSLRVGQTSEKKNEIEYISVSDEMELDVISAVAPSGEMDVPVQQAVEPEEEASQLDQTVEEMHVTHELMEINDNQSSISLDLSDEMPEKNESDACLVYENLIYTESKNDHVEYVLSNADSITVESLEALTTKPEDSHLFPMTSGKRVNSSELYEELEGYVAVCDTQDAEPEYTFVLGEEEDTFLPPETGEGSPILLSEAVSKDSDLLKYKEHQEQGDFIPKLEHENVSSNPNSAKKWNDLATYYKNANLFEQAVFANQKAVKLDPNSTQYLYDLGISFAVVGRHEEAIDCMDRVIEKNEQHALAHATLGGYYKKMGLEELAEQHIGIAMKNYIDDDNLYNRACLEALRGNIEESVQLLRSALEARQINVEWVLRDPDLDSIRFSALFKQLLAEFANY